VRLETLEVTLDWAESALEDKKTWRYFCPIWQQEAGQDGMPAWWMTFNHDTYIHDVIRIMGGENVFSQRVRLYPLAADLGLVGAQESGQRDTRYPRVTRSEVLEANPQVILLPSEPFAFAESHQEAFFDIFADTEAARSNKILTVDGSYLTWHGTRLARALSELPAILDAL
jgi:ABC-type Fe3+-hydroxamate transport system substrate-binding protein